MDRATSAWLLDAEEGERGRAKGPNARGESVILGGPEKIMECSWLGRQADKGGGAEDGAFLFSRPALTRGDCGAQSRGALLLLTPARMAQESKTTEPCGSSHSL